MIIVRRVVLPQPSCATVSRISAVTSTMDTHGSYTEEHLELEIFEQRVKRGDIAPHDHICFPPVTGNTFVAAERLEMYCGLYQQGPIHFQRYFHFDRVPTVSLILVAILIVTYWVWQHGQPHTPEALLQQGAMSRALMIELGQWWRLLTANLLHASGWHLLANIFFIFNLGGPAEAIFRRIDYLLILLGSALGTTLLSSFASRQISCGASGIVFGIWGAIAVFGVRHHALLPLRYRRYFLGSVIPYSIFALYTGFAWPGVDHWGHLGGLITGMGLAAWIPARLLAPPHTDHTGRKLTIIVGIAMLLLMACVWPGPPNALTLIPRPDASGLMVSVPRRWHVLFEQSLHHSHTQAFGNELGVSVAWEVRGEPMSSDLDTLVRQFVTEDMTSSWNGSAVQSIRMQEPESMWIDGQPARRIRTEVRLKGDLAWAEYVIVATHRARYVISVNAPMWLASEYRALFDHILHAIRMQSPTLSHAQPPSHPWIGLEP